MVELFPAANRWLGNPHFEFFVHPTCRLHHPVGYRYPLRRFCRRKFADCPSRSGEPVIPSRAFDGSRDASFFFLVPLGAQRRGERLAFATDHGLGVEVTAFVSGEPLTDQAARRNLERALSREFADFSGMRTFHGAFLDLSPHSQDDEIASASAHRIERDLVTAVRLGCEKVVFHLGFNPLVGTPRYRSEFLKRGADFWAQILTRHPHAVICLENQWEPDWTIFEELFALVDSPRLGLCFDAGHAHVHSHFAPEAWIRKMRPHLRHQHWTDNHGDSDRHAALGRGNIAWPTIIKAGAHLDTVTLEMDDPSAVLASLRYLAEQRPFLNPIGPLKSAPIEAVLL